jgi:hypothetical protein
LAFARAASVVDTHHLRAAQRATKEFYFVDFADEVGDWGRLMLAN